MSQEWFLTKDEIRAGMAHIGASPRDGGAVEMLIVRPEPGMREERAAIDVSSAGGADGDHWARGCWLSLPDGAPHPDVQLALINARLIDLISRGDRNRWAMNGDNIVLDLDLSPTTAPPGTRLAIGTAVLEITEEPHKGCASLAAKYGQPAAAFVNTEGYDLRLRGIYARVVQDGRIAVGDHAHLE